jgi:hypothetical protein
VLEGSRMETGIVKTGVLRPSLLLYGAGSAQAAAAAILHLRANDISASQRRRPRTRTRAFSSGFTSANRVEEGTEYGRKIGRRAANLYLRPVR